MADENPTEEVKKEKPENAAAAEPAAVPVEEKAAEPEAPKEAPAAKPEAEQKPVAAEAPKEVPAAEPKTEEKKTGPAKKEDNAEQKVEEKVEKPVDKTKAELAADEPEAKPKPKVIGIPPNKLLLFDKYDISEVTVTDAGLARYINLDPVMVPHTGAKHANRSFAKSKMNIVERLVNSMMRTEDYTGKKTKTYRVVMEAFAIIESKTKKNPVQIFIDALENTTPREEVTRLRYGGVSVPKAVDISSSRRLDIALRNICKGAVSATYKNTKPIEICLANELMLAAKGDMNSAAISKKEEVERIASSAR